MFSNLSLSFFDEEESSELANLSDSLGINLSLNMDQSQTKGDCPTTQSRLNRASEILQSSLRTSSLLNANEWKGNDVTNTSNVNKLKQELSDSRSRLKDLEANYKVLQVKILSFIPFFVTLYIVVSCIKLIFVVHRMQVSKH